MTYVYGDLNSKNRKLTGKLYPTLIGPSSGSGQYSSVKTPRYSDRAGPEDDPVMALIQTVHEFMGASRPVAAHGAQTNGNVTVVANAADPVRSTLTAEIEMISDRIRHALECPICLQLVPRMTCFCPNGHVVCEDCLFHMWTANTTHSCPMCRSPMTNSPDVMATTLKLSEVVQLLRVTCPHRSHGCAKLLPISGIIDHGEKCPYVPEIRCLVTLCQWVGDYDRLFDHARQSHPLNVTVESMRKQIIVERVNTIMPNQRWTYLARTPYGMFWVLMTRETPFYIRVGVFQVEPPLEPGIGYRGPTNIAYRIKWTDFNAKNCTRTRTKWVAWTSELNVGNRSTIDPYIVLRTKNGRMEISWYRHWFYDRNHPRNY